METATAPFEIHVDPRNSRTNRLIVAGHDLTSVVRSVQFSVDGNELPQLEVTCFALDPADLSGDAAVTIVNVDPAGNRLDAASLVAALDPEQVRAAVDARCLTMGADPIAVTIDVIAELVTVTASGATDA